MSSRDVNEQTGLDMVNFRGASTVSVEKVRDFLHDGRKPWDTKKKILNIFENDPVFDKSKRGFMTRTERYERGLVITNRIYELQTIHNWSEEETKVAISLIDESLPINLHLIAFEPVFTLQAGPHLLHKYKPLIASRGIIGCYLQTELGHGTNLSRLETTATFLPSTQEWDIHSPTLTSSKWWIGCLGKTATHGVVQAKLLLNGKDMGPHLFLVQLRSLEDHKVLPGIKIGDIGPKSMGGFAPTDNGFARFTHVRIPRENMLSGFAQVTEDGKYVKPPHAKISYGGMLYIRSTMVTNGGWTIARASTIAIRYATIRRQGEIGPDRLEKQIISYPSVYYRLLPILARSYVFIQLGRSLRLSSGDTSLLGEMHAITSGLKVYVTTNCAQDIEVARRSMGGHGYSAFSGLGRVYADYLPSATYEGDNFVLDQQVVRAALKSYRSLSFTSSAAPPPTTNTLSPSSNYLRHLIYPPSETSSETHDWSDHANIITLLERRAALMVREYAQTAEEPDASGAQRVSRAVTEAFVAARVGDMSARLDGVLDGRERALVGKVYHLYLLSTVEGALVDLFYLGLIPPSPPVGSSDAPKPQDPTRSLRLTINDLCKELVPEAIGLTDAFGFSDWELDSALGVSNGKVYEALWEKVQTEPLNVKEVTDAYETSIKPILQRGQRLAATREKTKL